jgi:hypothetical protein
MHAPDAMNFATDSSAAARACETAGDAREAALEVFHDMAEARVAPDLVHPFSQVSDFVVVVNYAPGEMAGGARKAAMDVCHNMLEARVAPDQVLGGGSFYRLRPAPDAATCQTVLCIPRVWRDPDVFHDVHVHAQLRCDACK